MIVLFVLLSACASDPDPADPDPTGSPEDTDTDTDTWWDTSISAEPTGGTASTAATGSSGSTGPTGDTGVDVVEINELALADAVQCGGTDTTVGFELKVDGDAMEGMIDLADSANFSSWNEWHTLEQTAASPGQTIVGVRAVLTGVSVSDWADGVGTVFTCRDHIDDPSIMSFIGRVYDAQGVLLDCVAWGQDPVGMMEGEYFNYQTPIAEEELVGCRVPFGAN